MGRVNRAGLRDPATVVVVTRQIAQHNLYDPTTVNKTLRTMSGLQNPLSETDLVTAADSVYGGGYSGDALRSFREGLNHPDLAHFDDRLLAGAHRDWVDDVIENADGRLDVVPRTLMERYTALQDEGLWLEANALLVPIRITRFNRSLLDRNTDPWMINCPYSSTMGLQLP
jgi:hypothetical protein